MIKPTQKYLMILILGIIFGFAVRQILPNTNNIDNTSKTSNPTSTNEESVIEERKSDPQYKLINPLLECNNGDYVSRDSNLNALKKVVQETIANEILNDDISYASVYYRDLNNGPWFGINEKEYFSPASLIKVPLMIAYFKQAESDSSILMKQLQISGKAREIDEQNIKPEMSVVQNEKYSIEELINRMIIYSDNEAYQTLLDNIDNSLVFQVYEDLGVDISKGHQDPSGNIITVKDYSSFFRILYNSSYLSKPYSEKALQILSQTKFSDGIRKSIPNEVVISHKFGERKYSKIGEIQLHDCGIIYNDKSPYLLCIMTRGKDFSKDAHTIDKISSIVYKHLTSMNI